MTDDSSIQSAKRPLGATIMIVIGVLWMSLTGLCTAGFVVSMATQIDEHFDIGMLLQWGIMCLVVGAICTLPGIGIWLVGRWWAKRR